MRTKKIFFKFYSIILIISVLLLNITVSANYSILLAKEELDDTKLADIIEELEAPVPESKPEEQKTDRPNIVQLSKDDKGWKVVVDGKNFFVKGITWSYTPIGENYSYNLWSKPDEEIKKVIDYDAALMKEMGVNAIRHFGTIPPKWVKYLYEKYGIWTIINDLVGRYGVTVKGRWVFPTDYSDPETRKTLIQNAVETVKKYKDVPGVLFFIFGNENNYGLEWRSTEIENLPVGERHKAKAKYLYSLFEEILKEAKKIDKNHPVGIVNGDLQYIELIAEHCKSLDIMGANVYRGMSATDLFKQVKAKLDKPFMFTEFGCDAFNVKTGEEDQYHQALFTKSQWLEIYHKSYGKGEEQNCIGGLVFEWLDEWWKTGQTFDLDIHNENASWENGGYYFDFEHGVNNMNEEWWGICAISKKKVNGINQRIPRAAYYVLQKIWKIDPYTQERKTIDTFFDSLDLTAYISRGELNTLKNSISEEKKIKLTGGRIKTELVSYANNESIKEGKQGLSVSDGQMAFIDFGFAPLNNLKGTLSLNVLGNVADKKLEYFYGDRAKDFEVLVTTNDVLLEPTSKRNITDNERVEIYSFSFDYYADIFELKGFYHTGHYHWLYEGDFFGLLQEANDIPQYDIWNAKPPIGVEFIGRKELDGLKILAGPEIYWGANPKIIGKYYRTISMFDVAIIHSEDLNTREATSTVGGAGAEPATRKTSLYLKTWAIPFIDLELGGLFASPEKIGETFTRVVKSDGSGYLGSGYDVIKNDSIKLIDTLAGKARLTTKTFADRFNLFGELLLAGLVADGGPIPGTDGSLITDPGTGNRIEYKAGARIFLGDIQIAPKALYRKPLVGPNPIIDGYIATNGKIYPGLKPRNIFDDPFAVVGNREATIGEIVITYDPTGANWFYNWDNDEREDAKFAADLVLNYASYPTFTDAGTYVDADGSTKTFPKGLPKAKVWTASSKIVINPLPDLKVLTRIQAGEGQSTGMDERLVKFYSLDLTAAFKQLLLKSYFKKDMWAPYDFYRQFNLTYPLQWMVDLSYCMQTPLFMSASSRIGLKYIHRVFDEYSAPAESQNNELDYAFETTLYYEILF